MRDILIGVTRCRTLDDYVAAVERAGGRVRVLEVTESPRKVLGDISGILLTGGGDVDPAFYGEERHATIEDAEPGRDEFEIDLARRAISSDVPALAICRGAQVLNVAAGGSLVQDIPSAVPGALRHTVRHPKDALAHAIAVTPGSRLGQLLGAAVDAASQCEVNSRHHQSVARIGNELVACATAPDGVIEAIEVPDARFCLGIQWHPENFWRSGAFGVLFAGLVDAARAPR